MKNIGLLILIGMLFGGTAMAQEGYTISGKLRGVSTDRVYVVSADFVKADTLSSAAVRNDSFVLEGVVPDGVRMVNLVFAGMDSRVPLMLENRLYQVQVTAEGAVVNGGGGEASQLFAAFNKVGEEYAAEQAAIQEVYAAAGNDANRLSALQARLDAAYKGSVQKTLELIKANPDSYVSAYVVAASARTDGETLARQKYGLLGDAALKTTAGKAVEAALARYDNLAVGKPAPDFTVTRPNGDALTLYAVPNKIKLVVFWASWDAASRQVNPQLIALYQQFRPKSFEIVSVSLDDNRFAWDRAIDQDGISIWSNGSDLKGLDSPVAKAYMVGNTLPYTVLIDSENKIVAKGLLGSDLRNAIAELVKKNKKNRKDNYL